MKLKRFLLRYYPPGIIVEFQRKCGDVGTRTIDLVDLSASSEVEKVVAHVLAEETRLLSSRHKPVLMKLVIRLIDKLNSVRVSEIKFESIITQSTHILPMTNCALNKDGSRFATASYDRTCKVWDSFTGAEQVSLEGIHTNVVYALSFNAPFSDRIITGSFDKTAAIWNSLTGEPLHHLQGHAGEIVCVAFSPNGRFCATGSMDNTARIWDAQTGNLIHTATGHTGEIVSVVFSGDSSKLLTGSFDTCARVWDVDSGKCLLVLQGHSGEISSSIFPSPPIFPPLDLSTAPAGYGAPTLVNASTR